ncbi:hypothetical protein BH11PSE11_BH11PSE11_27690 [soil metagenome]
MKKIDGLAVARRRSVVVRAIIVRMILGTGGWLKFASGSLIMDQASLATSLFPTQT